MHAARARKINPIEVGLAVTLLGAALALLLTLVVAEKPALAAFPGTNGKIVFFSPQSILLGDPSSADYEIFTMNPDGTGVSQLTSNAALETQPAWSPDGQRLAFLSNRDGNSEIYVMDAAPESATNQPVRLTNNATDDSDPAWSPSGTKIAFASNRDGDYEVFTMKPDGSSETKLTKNPVDDFDPDWQPIVR